jgi:hypothetical protein
MSLKREPGDDSGDDFLSIPLFSLKLTSAIQQSPAYAASLVDVLFGTALNESILTKNGEYYIFCPYGSIVCSSIQGSFSKPQSS